MQDEIRKDINPEKRRKKDRKILEQGSLGNQYMFRGEPRLRKDLRTIRQNIAPPVTKYNPSYDFVEEKLTRNIALIDPDIKTANYRGAKERRERHKSVIFCSKGVKHCMGSMKRAEAIAEKFVE